MMMDLSRVTLMEHMRQSELSSCWDAILLIRHRALDATLHLDSVLFNLYGRLKEVVTQMNSRSCSI